MPAMEDEAGTLEDLEIDLLLEGVFRHFGHDFRGYRRETLRRRLHAQMQCEGVATVSALQARVMHDAAAGGALLRALSARPVALFEQPAFFRALRPALVPLLRSCPVPRIWVAECVAAEEVCALAMLLAEDQLLGRTQIFATAANEALLQEAREGRFSLERLPQYAHNYRESGGKSELAAYYGERDGQGVFSEQLRSSVTWAQYSLATDASFNEFQLVLCRHAFADFGAVLRHRALQLFCDSMPLFGILGVDGAGGLDSPPFAHRYRGHAGCAGLYQRVA